MKLRKAIPVAMLLLGFSWIIPAAGQPPRLRSNSRDLEQRYNAISNRVVRRTGDMDIPGAHASIHVNDQFFYLDQADARRVLINLWAYSPEDTKDVIGMVFAKQGYLHWQFNWGAVIRHSEPRHIKENDIGSINSKEILSKLQQSETYIHRARAVEGLDPLHFEGWISPPLYDRGSHTIGWSRNVSYGGSAATANYHIRFLSRTGVVSVKICALRPAWPEVWQAARYLRTAIRFEEGARYEDFDSFLDAAASFSISDMVENGVEAGPPYRFEPHDVLPETEVWVLAVIMSLMAAFRKRTARFGFEAAEAAGEAMVDASDDRSAKDDWENE